MIFSEVSPSINGTLPGLWDTGTIIYTCVIVTVTMKLALETHHWTLFNHIANWGSILVWFIFLLIYGIFWSDFKSLGAGEALYYTIYEIGTYPAFYFTILLIPVICLFRDFLWKFFQRNSVKFFQPDHIIQEIQQTDSTKGLQKVRQSGPLPRPLRSEISLHSLVQAQSKGKILHTGYAFASEDGSNLQALFAKSLINLKENLQQQQETEKSK